MPALDGLRGLAILSVILFHTSLASAGISTIDKIAVHLANLGWIGVDLFFVLSGFLITGILLDERDKPHFFRTFYSRRVLRIVPVYVAFLLFSMWTASVLGAAPPESSSRLREIQAWYWTYSVNVYVALRGWAAVAQGTTHLWSLSVEEQFYLVWPFAVFLLPRRYLPRLAIACVVLAEACRVAFAVAGARGEIVYVLLPTRMDTLAIGGLLACAVRDAKLMAIVARWRRPLTLASFLALLPPLIAEHRLDFHRPLTQLFAYPAIAILSGALVLTACESPRWFSSRGLQFAGRYSYGMYIWHPSVATALLTYSSLASSGVIAGSYLPSYVLSYVALLTASIGVALLSWYAIERPFLSLKRFVPYS